MGTSLHDRLVPVGVCYLADCDQFLREFGDEDRDVGDDGRLQQGEGPHDGCKKHKGKLI